MAVSIRANVHYYRGFSAHNFQILAAILCQLRSTKVVKLLKIQKVLLPLLSYIFQYISILRNQLNISSSFRNQLKFQVIFRKSQQNRFKFLVRLRCGSVGLKGFKKLKNTECQSDMKQLNILPWLVFTYPVYLQLIQLHPSSSHPYISTFLHTFPSAKKTRLLSQLSGL